MTTIFKNRQKLSYRDFILQVLLTLVILGLVYLFYPIIKPKHTITFQVFISISVLLIGLISIKTFKERTVLQIDIDESTKNMSLIIQQQFKGFTKIEFQKETFKYEVRNIPGRSYPPIKEILFKDNNKLVTLSTRQVGVDSNQLECIMRELKRHYP